MVLSVLLEPCVLRTEEDTFKGRFDFRIQLPHFQDGKQAERSMESRQRLVKGSSAGEGETGGV